MRIITYNVNGIRAAISKGLIDWVKAAKPDVLCLQETKATSDQLDVSEFEALGYHLYWFSAQKKAIVEWQYLPKLNLNMLNTVAVLKSMILKEGFCV